MCGACEADHGRRWTSARVLVLMFVGALLVLSVLGVIVQVRTPEVGAADPCKAAASAAVRFQSDVTRNIGRPVRLRSDTTAFLGELRSLGAASCPETQRFLVSAERTIGELCPSCASELRRVRTPGA